MVEARKEPPSAFWCGDERTGYFARHLGKQRQVKVWTINSQDLVHTMWYEN
jgi:hypothetical protein